LSAGQFICSAEAIFRRGCVDVRRSPQQQFAHGADELRMIQTLSALFRASDCSIYGVAGLIKPTEPG
jgi:hypothetical protein